METLKLIIGTALTMIVPLVIFVLIATVKEILDKKKRGD